ncbi:hypothetical protein [Rhodoplanes azumiensis]|uniref:Cysteine rich repeat-containing protein n=1 Tax=Rhodoplanes azumiensis TaxID=1897628 RepID=A0ABW5AN71_9BRAD
MTAHAGRSRFVGAALAVVLAFAVTLATAGRPAAAASRTIAPQAACTGDVFRLCGSEAPRVDQIIACLKKARPDLSPACKAVVDVKG